jgi:peptide/nickel transport system permease protein
VIALKEREFVEAARALGAPGRRIVLRHLVPNAFAPLTVQASFGVGGAILSEASLSFLGLGPQDSHSWGMLLDQGTSHILVAEAHHLALYPGLAILLVVMGFNLLGDALRDRFDPKS